MIENLMIIFSIGIFTVLGVILVIACLILYWVRWWLGTYD